MFETTNLGRYELHPVLNVIASLGMAGFAGWFLTRLDEEARRLVESRRCWGYQIADYELEVQKTRNRIKYFYLGCTIISLAMAAFCSIPLLRELSLK
jgi:hypothetical protein